LKAALVQSRFFSREAHMQSRLWLLIYVLLGSNVAFAQGTPTAAPISIQQLLKDGYEVKAAYQNTLFLQSGKNLYGCVYNVNLTSVETAIAGVRSAVCRAISER
jgi:hypothetical protein